MLGLDGRDERNTGSGRRPYCREGDKKKKQKKEEMKMEGFKG
jgi:hypothetical protein